MFVPLRTIVALFATALIGFTFAQDMGGVTVGVAQSDAHGPYLVDGEGYSLYLFADEARRGQGPERMTEGVREAAVSCTGDCLDAWPALTSEAEVTAGDGLEPALLYTAEVDGRSQVVYDGWPLYTFARDEEPGQTVGQAVNGFGGTWYLVAPSGTAVGPDGSDGAMGDGSDDDSDDGRGAGY